MHGADDILGYWFGALDGPYDLGKNGPLWWRKDDEVDRRIAHTFGPDIDRAVAGELDAFRETPRGSLALVIVLDQFPRNAFRGTPRSFAHDALAREVTRDALARGHDASLRLVERQFLTMPLMHSEDLADHARLAAYIETTLAGVPAEHRGAFASWAEFAAKHEVIVRRFGRYPHRNEILSRASTPEERDFLTQPGSSF